MLLNALYWWVPTSFVKTRKVISRTVPLLVERCQADAKDSGRMRPKHYHSPCLVPVTPCAVSSHSTNFGGMRITVEQLSVISTSSPTT